MAHGTDQAIFGLGADNEATDIAEAAFAEATQAELDAAITAAKAALTVTSLAGQVEATPGQEVYTVTGMAATSVIVSVLFLSTEASVATIEVLNPAEWTPGANTLTSVDEVDRSNDQLIVTYFA